MKHPLITIALLALFAAAGGANAQIYNPDDESQTVFANNVPVQAAVKPPTGVTQPGTVSPDGRYVFIGGERGWTNRQHSYVFVGGRLVHTAGCLAMDEPRPQLTAANFHAMSLAERTSDR